MGAEGKKETTSNVGDARYPYTTGLRARPPYSFAIVAPCGKTHYYSWQGSGGGTWPGGPSPWGLTPCGDTRSPRMQGRDAGG